MVGYIASYFFGSTPVHLTDMHWQDEKKMVEIWTQNIPGRRSTNQDLYLLIGPSTFSAPEDFAYSLRQLKRATLVGEKTGGGAHMGRGLQRLSPLFTAFIPTGESLNPITKSNWENVGVEPDVEAHAENALDEAHRLALRRLIEQEDDPKWKSYLRQALEKIDKSTNVPH
jgi:C-terminal processing protease CtpA/Prc